MEIGMSSLIERVIRRDLVTGIRVQRRRIGLRLLGGLLRG